MYWPSRPIVSTQSQGQWPPQAQTPYYPGAAPPYYPGYPNPPQY